MKKRAIALFLAVMMIFSLLPVSAFAEEPAEIVASGYCGAEGDGTNIIWKLDSNGTLILNGNGAMKDYLPVGNVKFNTTDLTECFNYYNYHKQIKRIEVGEGITALGMAAFYDCKNMESISLPDSLTLIAKSAFYCCTSLKEIKIPKSTDTIEFDSFRYCPSIEKVELAEGNTHYCLDDGVLYSADQKFLVLYPAAKEGTFYRVKDGATQVDCTAFHSNQYLQCVILPETVSAIDLYAFVDAASLKSIYLPKALTYINTQAFNNCSSLTDVYYGGTEDEWSQVVINAFNYSLNNVKMHYSHNHDYIGGEITLPTCTDKGYTTYTCSCGDIYVADYVDPLGHDYGEWYLTKVPTGTEKGTEQRDCSRCDAFETREVDTNIVASGYCGAEGDGSNAEWTLYKDGTLVISGRGATKDYLQTRNAMFYSAPLAEYFEYREMIKQVVVEEGITSIGNTTFYGCVNMEEISLPDTLTRIGASAFSACSSLKEITIPAGVTDIGLVAFDYCPSLEKAVVEAGNSKYCSEDGVIFTVDGESLILYPAAKSGSTYTVKDGVKIIDAGSFHSNQYLEHLALPETVAKISLYAFEETKSIQTMYLPESLTYINTQAYYNCYSMKDVYYGGTEEQWSAVRVNMFNYSLNAATIHCAHKHDCVYTTVIEPTVNSTGLQTGICSVCFASVTQTIPKLQIIASGYCGGDTKAEYDSASKSYKNLSWTLDEEGTLTISGTGAMKNYSGNGSYAPWDKKKIIVVDIEAGVTSIGSYAFDACSNLKSITIPDGVTSIGTRAISACKSLKSVTIPGSVTHISDYAFCECTGLESITISDGVTSIGSYAFCYCNPTSLTIPGSVRNIGEYAFNRGYKCTSISVAESNKYYSSMDGVLFNKNKTTLIQYPAGNAATEYVIPDGVTTIGREAFYGSDRLTSITIPDSLTSIGSDAFFRCRKLTSINAAENNKYFSSIDGVLFNQSKTKIIHYPAGNAATEYVIPDSVTSIGSDAFCYCRNLTSITIPNGVTSIPTYAFEFCSSLKSITIPNGVTSIGRAALSNCSSLESITIPGSVTSIGGAAFDFCTQLKDVYYCGTEEQWEAITIAASNDYLKRATRHYHDYQAVATNPSCTEKGYTTYTCSICGDSYIDENSYVPATGHSYSEAIFSWSNDGKTCTVKCVCANDTSHVLSGDATVTGAVKTEATCTTMGTTTYTAKITLGGVEYTDTKDVTDIPVEGHSFTNYVSDGNATCTEDGTKTAKCDYCDATQTITDKGSATGHSYGQPTFAWDGFNCSAYIACSCGDTQAVKCTVTSEVTSEATTKSEGVRTYTATVTVDGQTYTSTKTESIPKLPDSGTNVIVKIINTIVNAITGIFKAIGALFK